MTVCVLSSSSGDEGQRRDADAGGRGPHGLARQLSAGDVRPHEGLLDLQVSGVRSRGAGRGGLCALVVSTDGLIDVD